jgi:hypothetical protein
MLKAFVGFVVGYYAGERLATDAVTPCENGSASGWLSAFLILVALLAWVAWICSLTPGPARIASPRIRPCSGDE